MSRFVYTSAGVPLWTNRYNGPGNGSDIATAAAVDVEGKVFEERAEAEAVAVNGTGQVIVTGASRANGHLSYATVAYSSMGMPLWTNLYNGPGEGDDAATALVVDGQGNVFVTGYSYRGTADYATIKYSASTPMARLYIQRVDDQVVLSWTNAGYSLQSAPIVTGIFTNIPGATSPFANSLKESQRYFRLKGN